MPKFTANSLALTSDKARKALAVFASPEKAKASAWYFKTGVGEYGAGDQFIGVTVPQQRKVAKQFWNLPIDEVEKLLQSPIHEHRLTALFILVGQYQKGKNEVRQLIVDLYLKNLDYVDNWDLVDSSAPYILGDWLVCHPEQSEGSRTTKGKDSSRAQNDRQKTEKKSQSESISLPSWAKSKNVWHRRIAMITCGGFIRVGQFDGALKIAKILVHDSHDLIQKAAGWMLREIGNRNQAVELAFLDQYAATMPRTMLRYAIEKFPPDLRQHYLNLKMNA